MEQLERYRRANDRRTNWAMGRVSREPRVYDSEVRADASKWDVLRLPPDPYGTGSAQDDTGRFVWVAGLDAFTSDVTF